VRAARFLASSRFRLTLLACFLAVVLCTGMGAIAAIRVALLVLYGACLITEVSRTGPKILGITSVACGMLINLAFLVPLGGLDARHSVFALCVAEAVGVVVTGSWIAGGIFAIRTSRSPNRAIGFLSLVLILSPGVLQYMDHFQYVVLTNLQFEWWHVRPFDSLCEWLWFGA
jgi:hypothetical protein